MFFPMLSCLPHLTWVEELTALLDFNPPITTETFYIKLEYYINRK